MRSADYAGGHLFLGDDADGSSLVGRPVGALGRLTLLLAGWCTLVVCAGNLCFGAGDWRLVVCAGGIIFWNWRSADYAGKYVFGIGARSIMQVKLISALALSPLCRQHPFFGIGASAIMLYYYCLGGIGVWSIDSGEFLGWNWRPAD